MHTRDPGNIVQAVIDTYVDAVNSASCVDAQSCGSPVSCRVRVGVGGRADDIEKCAFLEACHVSSKSAGWWKRLTVSHATCLSILTYLHDIDTFLLLPLHMDSGEVQVHNV